MLRTRRTFNDYGLLSLMLLFVLSATAAGQQPADSSTQSAIVSTNKPVAVKHTSDAVNPSVPLYKDFRGVTLGMAAEEVRGKLGSIKNKGERQDFFVFSDTQSAQVVYDDQGKVTTISVDYTQQSEAPSPESVLGEPVKAKQDGSIYQLRRYPDAGYWIAYSRTAGDSPIVTITMQKL